MTEAPLPGSGAPAAAAPAAGPASGKLERIWVKRAKLGPMDPHPTAHLIAGEGIAGNSNRGGRRQVTVISAEGWADAIAELDGGAGTVEVDPSARRANLMVSGLPLAETGGRVLRVGACRVLIRGETRPCERMERARAGLKAALGPDWRGGVFGEVIEGGEIAVGDPVGLEPVAAVLPQAVEGGEIAVGDPVGLEPVAAVLPQAV